jgi:hypothetical protein
MGHRRRRRRRCPSNARHHDTAVHGPYTRGCHTSSWERGAVVLSVGIGGDDEAPWEGGEGYKECGIRYPAVMRPRAFDIEVEHVSIAPLSIHHQHSRE